MAKAILAEPERDEALDQEAMWNTLVRQAKAEGSSAGQVFSKALVNYLKEHGDPGVADYLWSLKRK